MRIMGIDPGTLVMGYGVLDEQEGELSVVAYGALKATAKAEMPERLRQLYHGAQEIMVRFHPNVLAVEEPFVALNVRSAMAVGRAQAIAILAAAEKGIPICAYTPAKVKQRVANYGTSSKLQIQEMVKLQLGMAELPEPTDAADALAVALCHFSEQRLAALMPRSEGRRGRR